MHERTAQASAVPVSISVSVSTSVVPSVLRTDQARVQRVLMNALSNAVKVCDLLLLRRDWQCAVVVPLLRVLVLDV
jgi:signal transduction histidine kinase